VSDPANTYLFDELKTAIANNQVVVICGAGTSIATVPSKRDQLSWRGLLLTALAHCAGINKADAEQVSLYTKLINRDDFEDMIGAAEWISKKLGGPKGGELRNWLRHQVGSLKPEHTGLLEALHELGAPLATTNYDGLISDVTGLKHLTWREDNKVERWLKREDTGVLHLHGHWDDSESVILGIEDYGTILGDAHAQAMQQAMRSVNTLLFVGCGDTTEDPNFGAWLKWSGKVFAGSEYRHYRLELFGKGKTTQAKHPDEERIKVIEYGQHDKDYTALEPFLRSLAPTGSVKTASNSTPATRLAHGTARERNDYKTSMDGRYGVANLQGLYAAGPGYARDDVMLHEIFVMPDLEPLESETSARKQSKDTPKDAERYAKQRERFERKEPARQRQVAGQVFQTQPKLLIVGDPGQGKSTLLQHHLLEALTPWTTEPEKHPCPVYMRLSELETMHGQVQLLESAQAILIGAAGSRIEAETSRTWLESGVLWLLDGLDEIRDPNARKKLREFIASRQGTHPQDRWVMTSRPGPASSERIGSAWVTLHLSELNDPQVLEVLRNWAGVLRRKEGEDQSFDPAVLSRTLAGQSGLSRMYKNSLLLTMMVLFYKAKKRLPDDRWEFYVHADDVLRNAWVRPKHSDEVLRDGLPGNYLKALLPVLAFECMKRGVVAIKTDLLQDMATPTLKKYGYSGRDLSDEQERLKRAAEDLIGVLVSRGPDTVGFLHLTFQEFHTAQHLLNLADPTREIALYWDDPDWSEVWNLYVLGGAMREGLLEQLFKTIRTNQHEWDGVLFRPELKVLQLAGVGRQPLPESESWRKVFEWAWQEVKERTWQEEQIQASLKAWEKVWPGDLITHYMENLNASENQDWTVRENAAQALASQASDPNIQKALLKALTDEGWSVRARAAQSLASQASDPTVQQALLNALEDNEWSVREGATQALASQASDPTVQQALLNALEDNEWSVREGAVQALTTHANIPIVQQALVKALQDDGWSVRWRAAQALASQVNDPAIQQALFNAFQNRNLNVRESAAQALATQASNPNIQQALLNALQREEWSVRESAAKALASQASDPTVQQALLNALEDNKWSVRESAAQALATQANIPIVQHALLKALQDEGWSVRARAAQVLATQANNPTVKQALLHALRDKEWSVREGAVNALTTQTSDPTVQEALLSTLQDKERDVQKSTAKALANFAAHQRRAALEKPS
jgi:HEAT repeat protein